MAFSTRDLPANLLHSRRMNLAGPSRRSFLKAAGLAGTAIAFGEAPWKQLAAVGMSRAATFAPSWIDKPMRWAQLTLVEDDPGNSMRSSGWITSGAPGPTRSCLSAGGCLAYYPTKVPFHHRSAWLGGGDPFGELVAGCRKLGMVVIARTDPHATYDDAAKGAPGLDRRNRRRPAAAPLGLAGDVGHVRTRPLQLRVHDRGEARDHDALSGGRHFHQIGGMAPANVTANIAGRISRRPAASSCRARTIHKTPRAGPTFSGISNGCSTSGSSGTARSEKSTRTRA